MKRFLVIFLSLLLTTSYLSAQEKVVESSARRAPEWIGTTQSGYIITSSESATLEDAKRACLANIQQSIISGVAVNISSQETTYNAQLHSGENYYVTQNYESRVEAIATKLPYLQGITIDNSEIYWQRVYNKADKSYKYVVHVKYPFSAAERNAIISEFRRTEKEHNDKFQQIAESFSTFTEVEYIGRAMTDLDALCEYYIDDVRKSEVLALKEKFRKLYGAISITPYYTSLGEIVYSLNLDGRRVVTSRKPVIKSEYATQIEYTPSEDNLYRVTYNYEYCQPEDENKIDISYQFTGGAVARHTFYFDPAYDHIEVVPFGQIELDIRRLADEATGNHITHIKGYMDLRSKQERAFRVVGINILFDSLGIRVDDTLSAEFEGKGNHRLTFDAESLVEPAGKKDGIANGTITILNADTNKSENIRFYLPFRITI